MPLGFQLAERVLGAASGIEDGLQRCANCMLYFPHSIVACGSELRLNRRMTILAWDRGSASSASDLDVSDVFEYRNIIGVESQTCSSSTDAASIRPIYSVSFDTCYFSTEKGFSYHQSLRFVSKAPSWIKEYRIVVESMNLNAV